MRPVHRKLLVLALFAALAAGTSQASTFLKVDVDALSRTSEAVLHARVLSVESAWNPEHTFIFTHVTLEPVATLAGGGERLGAPGAVVVRVPGGTVDDFTAEMIGAPRFREGEEVVVFIARWDDGALMVDGYEQGVARIAVDAAGNRVLQGGAADGLPLVTLAERLARTSTPGGER